MEEGFLSGGIYGLDTYHPGQPPSVLAPALRARILVFQGRGRRDCSRNLTSVKDLARKLRRYINAYSANAKPIQWRHSDPTRRIRNNVVSATCH